MSEDFKAKQKDYWEDQAKKYQQLYFDKVLKEDLSGDGLDLYRYAMWFCQDQKMKYY